jgi:tetratricopeptide (TPR) repeat protein
MDESLQEARLSKQLDPLSMTVNADFCWYLNFAQQYQQAQQECSDILHLEPKATWTHLGLVEALLQQKNWPQALAQLRSALNIPTQELAGTEQQAIQEIYQNWLLSILNIYQNGKIDAYFVATLYAQLNQPTEAIEWLQTAIDEENGFIVFIRVDPRFNSLRKLAGFEILVEQIF